MSTSNEKVQALMPDLRDLIGTVDMSKVDKELRVELMELCLAIVAETYMKTIFEGYFPTITLVHHDEDEAKPH